MIKKLKTKITSSHHIPILLALRYAQDHVGSRAAALAYYFLFSIFPLVILLASILGRINLDPGTVNHILTRFLPTEVVGMINSYLDYIHQSYNTTIMNFSIVFSIYFPYRAIKGLMHDVRHSFRLSESSQKTFLFKEILCTLLLPTTILVSLLLIVLGQNVIESILHFLLPGAIHLSSLMIEIWQYTRFLAAAILMGLSLGILYECSLDHWVPLKKLLPGIGFAIGVWIISSIGFSIYVENYANYSVIYGTLGAFIVLMLWLYLTSLIFIMGSELNAILFSRNPK